MQRKFHAAEIDRAVARALLPHVSSSTCATLSWSDVYEAACAYGNLRLAQDTDRLEDWSGLFEREDRSWPFRF